MESQTGPPGRKGERNGDGCRQRRMERESRGSLARTARACISTSLRTCTRDDFSTVFVPGFAPALPRDRAVTSPTDVICAPPLLSVANQDAASGRGWYINGWLLRSTRSPRMDALGVTLSLSGAGHVFIQLL